MKSLLQKNWPALIIMALLLAVFIDNVWSQANTWPDFRGNMLGVPLTGDGGTLYGSVCFDDPADANDALCCYDGDETPTCLYRTDDANSKSSVQNAEDVWPFATTARTPGHAIIRPGADSKTANVLHGLGGCGIGVDWVAATYYVGGNTTASVTTCAYGTVSWCNGGCADDETAATALAVCLDAGTGIASTATAGTTCPGGAAGASCVGVTQDRRTSGLILSQNDATCTVISNGADGIILTSGKTSGIQYATSDTGATGLGNYSGSPALCVATGAAYDCTRYFQLNVNGNVYMNGRFGVSVGLDSALSVYWNARESLSCPNGDDQLSIKDSAGTSGFCFDTTTDSLPHLRDKGCTTLYGAGMSIPGPVTKGQTMPITSVNANCTFPGGGAGTCVTSAFIPIGASIIQVTGRQVTPNTSNANCTSCQAGANMGAGLDADQYGALLECDVNDTLYTTATAKANVMGTCLVAGGCTITMTANGAVPSCANGIAAWTVHYIAATAATSD